MPTHPQKTANNPPQDPEGGDEMGFLMGLLNILVPESVRAGVSGLATGENPLDQGIRGAAGAVEERRTSRTPPEPLNRLLKFVESPAAMGLVVPNVPGGPIFKDSKVLRQALQDNLNTDDLLAFVRNAGESIANRIRLGEGRGGGSGHQRVGRYWKSGFDMADNVGMTEITAISDAGEAELARRALQGDAKAMEYFEEMVGFISEIDGGMVEQFDSLRDIVGGVRADALLNLDEADQFLHIARQAGLIP